MIAGLLLIIIVLMCCKQEERGLTLAGILAVLFIVKYVIPFGAYVFLWMGTGDAPINPLWLLLVILAMVIGVRFITTKRVDEGAKSAR